MKILQVGKFYSPTMGGMERVVRELCEGLVERGHDVRAVVSSEQGMTCTEIIKGVQIHRLPTYGKILSQPLALGLRKAIQDFGPDIVHIHAPNPLALLGTYSIGTPKVITFHAVPEGVKRHLDRLISTFASRRARTHIFSSEETARLWFGAPNSHIEVIPFGFRFDYLDKTSSAPMEEKLVLFVGRLVPYKGLDILIKAMEQVDGRLVIIGDGPLKTELQNLARLSAANDRIAFAGAVTDQALAQWYQRCAVYVQPSISTAEAFGISMLEAMRFAKPVISTDLPTGVRRVNLDGQTGRAVPPRDPIALANALREVLSNPDLAKRWGEKARIHQSEFSFESMISSHLDLYQKVVTPR